MPERVFVCGMLRSGTSLIQTLLTNHPGMVVTYQPFHQLYVDAKRLFLGEHGIERDLPLDSGDPGGRAEREKFLAWLQERRFDPIEAEYLGRHATTGRGGGLRDWSPLQAPPGSFIEVRDALHQAMVDHLGGGSPQIIGSKEVLCEEYVPALLTAGIRCVLIIRDPRAVIASANNGRYPQMVGDRYPLMMLIRLWRKSAAYWLRHRNDPLVCAIRYEDLVADPLATVNHAAAWLGMAPFPNDLLDAPLKDHAGRPWMGNSSFGDQHGVDPGSRTAWRDLLDPQEQRFIAACTKVELEAIGYPVGPDLDPQEILDFREDTRGVRDRYLRLHPADAATLREEADRLKQLGHRTAFDDEAARRYLLFPDAIAAALDEGRT